jgi:hypothetical protein
MPQSYTTNSISTELAIASRQAPKIANSAALSSLVITILNKRKQARSPSSFLCYLWCCSFGIEGIDRSYTQKPLALEVRNVHMLSNKRLHRNGSFYMLRCKL